MSRTGIIVSTLFECAEVLDALTRRRTRTVAGVQFVSGRLFSKSSGAPVIVCISGVGKANAARAATLLIAYCKPSRLVNFGVGGAYPSSGLGIGDIVVAERESYGDEGLRLKNGFRDMADLGLPLLLAQGESFYNSFPLSIPEKLCREVRIGGFVTVSACTGTLAEGMLMERRWNALCENMEGAAIAHAALACGIALSEFRCISNIIEERSGAPLSRNDLYLAASAVQKFFLEAWHSNLFS